MTWYELLIFGLNFVGASAAAIVNGLAAGRRGMPVYRRMHTAIATLSVIYAGSYVWLLAELLSGADMAGAVLIWSSVMRGVALVVWPAVWCAPALCSLRIRRQLHEAVRLQREDMRP